MKLSQRLDNNRLAEVLAERGMVEPQALREAANYATHSRIPFAEALVAANLVQDWELARVVSELYGLPFVPVDQLQPDPKALAGIDPQFLTENCLVPVSRFGQLLTVCMPAMVPADVLGSLAATTDLFILPFVGSVRTNRQWIEKNLTAPIQAPLPSSTTEEQAGPGEWGSLFDQADAAVLLDLQEPPPDLPTSLG